ncbi:hypothetical protein CMI42_02755 [Candidatus Pacearchaeota archaeon]|nr:hypothetical protein [Candidatus Pacearchaeota archaeon]|tara:strand:- start:1034 stop:1633 length:600 start_codon:yes stop_codon:yes gene_type:complete
MADQKQVQKISRDTIISQILEIKPPKSKLLTEMLLDFGIHCIGCGASTFETLGQGVLGHGYSEDQLNKLVEDLNKVLESEDEPSKLNTVTSDFKLTLTEKAINKVKEAMKQREKENSTLRVSVLAGGCSGFMYDLEFVDNPVEGDLNMKQDGVNLAVAKDSMETLNGITIDFIDTLNESGFKFENPNASAGCGCGKSFN